MSGEKKVDRITNEYTSLGVASIARKIGENKLRWFGYVMRSDE